MAAKNRRPSKRVAVKQNKVAEFLRNRIISGELSRGSRLQPRRELKEQLKVSSVIIQRALNQLMNDGFVQSRGPHGTFVSENPPHLTRYGLVFPYRPTDRHPWRRFWTALRNEAKRLEQSRPLCIPAYYETGHAAESGCEDLATDVASRRVAGLFFAAPPASLAGQSVMNRGDLPRVVMACGEPVAGCLSIDLDMQSFFERAVADLASRGRRRVAILTVPHPYAWEAYLADALRASGMTTRSYWTQLVPQDQAEYAQNVVHMMFHAGQPERPDGLIVADDNLVEHVAMGLLAAGVKVPEELDVVAHCNHPWPTPAVIPVRRLGFDAREVMRLAIEGINEQLDGQRQHTVVKVGAVFEKETASA